MDNQRKRRQKPLSKKQKFIKDGVFYAELNDFLAKELAEQGYAGCEVRVTPKKTEIIIHANRTMKVVGDDGRRARELTKLIEKRFMFEPGTIKIFAQRIKNRGLSALSQAEAVRFRLFEGLSVRRACYSVLKWIMDRGAKGCEVIVSGKLRGQRAKSMKFREGYMIHAGDATNYYIDTAIKHVHLRQGVLGIKVKIMLPHKNDESKQGGNRGEGGGSGQGVDKQLPDTIKIRDPKELDPDFDRMEVERQKLNNYRGLGNFQQQQQPLHSIPEQQMQQQQQPPQQFQQQPIQDQQNMQQQIDNNNNQFDQQQQQQQPPMNQQFGQQQPPQQQFGQPQEQFQQQPPPQQQFQQFDPNQQQQQQQGGFQQYQ